MDAEQQLEIYLSDDMRWGEAARRARRPEHRDRFHRLADYATLAADVVTCTRCFLGEVRDGEGWCGVPMDEPAPKGIAVVGEAPGSKEAAGGRPFVGKSGMLLDRVLGEVGLGRDGVAVLNTVACRPPRNRDPLPAETAACRPLYERQLDFTGAWIVVLVGNKALQQVFPQQTVTDRRGIPTWHGGRIYIPTFHPAYILRNPRAKPMFANDLALAASIYRGDKWWPPITGTLSINPGVVDSEDVTRLHTTLATQHWAHVRSSKLEDDIVIVEDDLTKVPMKYIHYPRYTVQELIRIGSMGRGGQPTLGELASIHLVKRLGGTIVQ